MTPAVALLLLFLSRSGDEIDTLLDRLRTEDSAQRRRVQTELLRLGAAAIPAMTRALESASPRPEEEVARQLRRLGAPSWKERNDATRALVRQGRPAVPLLEARLTTADPEAAWRLRTALAEIREKAGRDELLEEFRAAALCDALGQAGDGRGVAVLLRVLAAEPADQRQELKRHAALAVGLLRGQMDAAQAEEASDRVLQVLERTLGPLEKGMLIKSLGRLGMPSAARPLAALLADRSEKNVHLKRSCVAALASLGQARGLRAIVDALGADDVYVRESAAAALESLAGNGFGYDPRAEAEANRESVAKFQAWGAAKYGKAWEE